MPSCQHCRPCDVLPSKLRLRADVIVLQPEDINGSCRTEGSGDRMGRLRLFGRLPGERNDKTCNYTEDYASNNRRRRPVRI